MINDTIRIRLSLGLIVVAIVHAILLGVVFTGSITSHRSRNPSKLDGTQLSTTSPSVGTIEKLQEPQSVNLQAQGEIKQQIRNCPPNCLPQTRLSRASGSSAHNRATDRRDANCDAYSGSPVPAAPNFVDTQKPTQEPLVVTPVSTPASPHRRRATRSPVR